MKKILLLLCCFIGFSTFVIAQQATRKLVLITLDGYRWQELFGGADSLLINNKKYVSSNIDELKKNILAFYSRRKAKSTDAFCVEYTCRTRRHAW